MATFYPCNKPINTVNIEPVTVEAPPSNLITSNQSTYHGRESFIKTCVNAYNHHHKLILTPDAVWLAIMTQFAGNYVINL